MLLVKIKIIICMHINTVFNEIFALFFQFGNTCYCNSVLQALYFCKPFRDRVLQHKQQQKHAKKETLLTCLSDLFHTIATQKKRSGSIAPKKFIQRLKKENGNLIFVPSFIMVISVPRFKCFIKVRKLCGAESVDKLRKM